MYVGEFQKRMEQIIRNYGYDFILSRRLLAATVTANGDGNPPLRHGHGYSNRDGKEIHGQTQHDTKRVYVRDDLSPEDIARTTAHELAHIALGHGNERRDPDALRKVALYGARSVIAPAEVEAETVADIVTSHYGFNDSPWSVDYVKGWIDGGAYLFMERDATIRKVTETSDRLITMIDSANP